MHKQSGYTFHELLVVLLFLVWIAVVFGIGYVVIHFVMKFW